MQNKAETLLRFKLTTQFSLLAMQLKIIEFSIAVLV